MISTVTRTPKHLIIGLEGYSASKSIADMLKLFSQHQNARHYEYQALESPSHFRLIELLPACLRDSRHVRCKIHHMDLEAPTRSYVALSYAWGESVVKSERIYINDNRVFYITKTLHSALSRLRPTGESFFLWVDAICINQAHDADATAERNAQVSRMHEIYSTAVRVIIDLGDFEKDDKVIVDGLTMLSLHDDEWETIDMDDITTSQLSSIKFPQETEPFWHAFSRLFQRPWFFRTWVIQELALGKESDVLLGSNHLGLHLFAITTTRAIKLMSALDIDLHLQIPTGFARIPWVVWINWIALRTLARVVKDLIWQQSLRQSWIKKQPYLAVGKLYDTNFGAMYGTHLTAQRSPHENCDQCVKRSAQWGPTDFWDIESLEFSALFFKFRHFRCKNPKDHVYGLLGLATDRNNPELCVNYSEPIETLSIRVSKYIISQGLGILVLYSARGIVKSPSWAISIADNAPIDFLRRLMLDGLESDWNLYKACGSTVLNLQVLPESNWLLARGMLIGKIYDHTDSFPMEPSLRFPESMSESFAAFLILLRVWGFTVSDWIQGYADTCTGIFADDFKRKCWKVLLADLWYSSKNICRLDGSLENEVFSSSIRAIFDSKKILGERVIAKVGSGIAETVLWRSLPGRKLGIALSHADQENEISNEAMAKASWMCLLPESARENDEIGILCGCRIPFVFRKDPGTEMYQVVGCCYVNGAMDGEIIEGKVEGEKWLPRDIILC